NLLDLTRGIVSYCATPTSMLCGIDPSWASEFAVDAGDDAIPWSVKWIAIACLIAFIWFAYAAGRRRGDFCITVRGGQVLFRGKFPPSRRADTTDFLLRELAPPGTVRVIGNWSAHRILRVDVQGKISTGDGQRIRNFLKITLRG